jgi:hypothetical protein
MTGQGGGSAPPSPKVHVSERWEVFLRAFYQPPNQLELGRGVSELDAVVAAAEGLLAHSPEGPVVLPAKLPSGTHYFAIAFDDDQARTLRELLASHLGTTWTDFDGSSLVARPGLDALDRAAIALAGGNSARVFRLQVANSARTLARHQVTALVRALGERPLRQARLTQPIGRILGDFADACATGAEQAARLAFGRLASDYRISAANRLFLNVQLLAAFGRWEELDNLAGLDEVVRLPRPALVSDALAQYALAQLANPADLADFTAQTAPRFGALVRSVSAIRSVASARYYVLWSLAGGESRRIVGERLEGTAWVHDEIVAEILRGPDDLAGERPKGDLRIRVSEALASGRYDAAIDLLAECSPSAADLPAVVSAVRATLTRVAIDLLDRYRGAFGDTAIDAALAQPIAADGSGEEVVNQPGWATRIQALLAADTPQAERREHLKAIESSSINELLATGGLQDVVAAVREAVTSPVGGVDTNDGIEGCIDLLREIHKSGTAPAGLEELAFSVLELWAYHDHTGNRRRLGRILMMVEILLGLGISPDKFDESVELLRLGWAAFLTDADLESGLDAIELLGPYRPDGSVTLDLFAGPILARIGMHNARRVSAAALAVAQELASEFGFEIVLPSSQTLAGDDAEGVFGRVAEGTVVALYSLMEGARERAAAILEQRHPGLTVVTLADHVASEQLSAVARTADLVVVMDRAAKHAATQALHAARGNRPIAYAAGKGSTSLIAAVEKGLEAIDAALAP